jgi:hypothetical protein
MAKKLIRLMATVGIFNYHGCEMFIELVKNLAKVNWQLHFLGIICLGTISCGSKFPTIRRLAFEQGLVPLVGYGDGLEDNSWISRCAVIFSMIEIYQASRESIAGLLSREIISNRANFERHPFVLELIDSQAAKKPQPSALGKTSFLFEYTSKLITENYIKTKNDYELLRKDIMSADRKAKQKRTIKKDIVLDKIDQIPITLTKRRTNRKFQNLENLVFSTEPYHQNYKKAQFKPGIEDDLYSAFVSLSKDGQTNLGPTFLGSKNHVEVQHNEAIQSNRRKLFIHDKPITYEPDALSRTVLKPVKMPALPPIQLK